jgi:hypothetical protein
MRTNTPISTALVLAAVLAIPLSCGQPEEESPSPGTDSGGGANDGGAGAATDGSTSSGGSGGTSGTGGASGSGGSSGSAGSAGSSSTGGSGGSSGTSGAGGSGATGGSGGACAPVTPVTIDPWDQRLPSIGTDGVYPVSSGGHADEFLLSPSQTNAFGVRLDWGGTVVFFGLWGNGDSNVLDAIDTGRELQVALYDPARARQPCAHDASCEGSSASCGSGITFLGWNPVQGGDECNRGAPVLTHGAKGDGMEITVQPLQWNPDWDATTCTQSGCGGAGRPVDVQYRSQYRFITENVVEVSNEVISNETFSHAPTGQEFPTMYVANGQNGLDLPVLLDAAGSVVGVNTPGAVPGLFYQIFTSPGPWVSWQNTNRDYGVGLAMDQGTSQFSGWRGDGSAYAYFHNVRAQIVFGLPAGGTVRGISYLALGSFDTVQSELEGVLASRAPFGCIDAPVANQPVVYSPGQQVLVRGWTLDNRSVSSVHARIDGVEVATFSVDGHRPDVCLVYPGYPSCPTAGYEGHVPTDGLDACDHLLSIVSRDGDGNEQVIGERVLTRQ